MTDLTSAAFDALLRGVRKPACYLGSEQNAIRKDPASVTASAALVFPDLYDIGMSHLGLKILYGIVNAQPDLAAERVFAPDEDFAAALAAHGLPLMSLESRRPLNQFDVIGFTIPYELSYTTILWMLDLARIPLRARDRGVSDPLVIGGGAGVYNPEPLAQFFDLFVLGDGEEVIVPLLREAAATRGEPRAERLRRLARIEGVYVPSLYEAEYEPDGRAARIAPVDGAVPAPRRTWLRSLSQSPFPVKMVVPFGEPAHDRLNVEIDRGCAQGCRFCQAGTTYRPVRERPPAETLEIFSRALKATGYGEISLTSLSAGDYSKIGPLLTALMDRYARERIAVSLPSLRPACVSGTIVQQIGRVRHTGFTIAAEAGTDRLRRALNKKVTDDEIFATARRLLAGGWRSLKLYFMLGLPTETDEDIDAIAALAVELDRLQEGNARFNQVTVSVSNFVPKPHTAFQWFGQDDVETLEAKRSRLLEAIRRHKRIKLKWHNTGISFLEAVFSRGDRRLGDAVERAYRLGRRLDAWTERFDLATWRRAFEETGLDPAFYANRRIPIDEPLPWSHIDTGLDPRYFIREYEHALAGEVTEDCKVSQCLACGLNPKECFKDYAIEPLPAPPPQHNAAPALRFRYRLTYHKHGPAKWLGHLETQRVILRAARAAGLPLAWSQGYHPHPKASFSPALPVGVESADERLDMEMTEYLEAPAIASKLNGALPEGFRFTAARQIALETPSIAAGVTRVEYMIQPSAGIAREQMERAVATFLALPSCMILRPRDGKQVDARARVESLTVDPATGALACVALVKDGGAFRPDDLLEALFPGSGPAPRAVKTAMRED